MSDSFIDLCASAATELGFSRPAGQIFGAVFGAAEPPSADDLCATLGLSRSNVSTALKDLRQAFLVGVIRKPGDRKEYFTTPDDPWLIVSRLVAARRRRLIDPLMAGLSLAEAEGDARAARLLPVLAEIGRAADSALRLEPAALAKAVAASPVESRKKDKKRKKR